MKQGKFAIPDSVKTSDSERLFGFIADAVATFLAKASPLPARADPQLQRRARARAPASQSARRPRAGVRLRPVGDLGFTFSFPVEQTGLASGTLVMWNKAPPPQPASLTRRPPASA